jgi:hypothetical protein
MLVAKVTRKAFTNWYALTFAAITLGLRRAVGVNEPKRPAISIKTGSSMRATKKSMASGTGRTPERVRNFLICLSETEFVPVHARSDVTKIRPKSLPAGHALTVRFA